MIKACVTNTLFRVYKCFLYILDTLGVLLMYYIFLHNCISYFKYS